MQLMLLHQEYLTAAKDYFRGTTNIDDLITSYDLTWSAFEILLIGSESANLMEKQGRLEIIVGTFESFKTLDQPLIHLMPFISHNIWRKGNKLLKQLTR